MAQQSRRQCFKIVEIAGAQSLKIQRRLQVRCSRLAKNNKV